MNKYTLTDFAQLIGWEVETQHGVGEVIGVLKTHTVAKVHDGVITVSYADEGSKSYKLEEARTWVFTREKMIKAKQEKFGEQLNQFNSEYPRDMLVEFYKYWSEPNSSMTKLRKDLERTWDLKRRLARWAKTSDHVDHTGEIKSKVKY